MKGKLIKRGEGDYKLFVNDTPFGQSKESPYNKLSLKNCQAISNGYDLDELASEYANKELNVELTSKAGNFYGFSSSFKEGFQKALELLGDNKFSEEDMRIAYDAGCNNIDADGDPIDEYNIDFYDTINSLQQTEWNVMFDYEYIGECNGNDGNGCFMDSCGHDCGCYIRRPKLDQNGCLILKRSV